MLMLVGNVILMQGVLDERLKSRPRGRCIGRWDLRGTAQHAAKEGYFDSVLFRTGPNTFTNGGQRGNTTASFSRLQEHTIQAGV